MATLAKERTFVPLWDKNKKKSEAEKVKVIYKAPTVRIKSRILDSEMKMTQTTDGKFEPNFTMNTGKYNVLSTLVKKVTNVPIEDENGDTQLTDLTVDELFDMPIDCGINVDKLTDEIYKFLMEALNGKRTSEKN